MRIWKIILPSLMLLCTPMLSSCKLLSGFLHDDEVVAKVGKHKLYLSELESVIPHGISPEDSLNIASQYIETWASEFVFEDAALKGLSRKDLNLASEIEQYRRVLVKYRYEQKFVNERLDTAVSDVDVKTYYEANKERYELSYPIVKARFIMLNPESPSLEPLHKLLAGSYTLDELEEFARQYADKYSDFGGEWIDIRVLAEEFDMDYGALLASMSDRTVSSSHEDGTFRFARITGYEKSGAIPPLEYCAPRIREAIVNSRKQELLVRLEQDLLEKARTNGSFVIY